MWSLGSQASCNNWIDVYNAERHNLSASKPGNLVRHGRQGCEGTKLERYGPPDVQLLSDPSWSGGCSLHKVPHLREPRAAQFCLEVTCDFHASAEKDRQ